MSKLFDLKNSQKSSNGEKKIADYTKPTYYFSLSVDINKKIEQLSLSSDSTTSYDILENQNEINKFIQSLNLNCYKKVKVGTCLISFLNTNTQIKKTLETYQTKIKESNIMIFEDYENIIENLFKKLIYINPYSILFLSTIIQTVSIEESDYIDISEKHLTLKDFCYSNFIILKNIICNFINCIFKFPIENMPSPKTKLDINIETPFFYDSFEIANVLIQGHMIKEKDTLHYKSFTKYSFTYIYNISTPFSLLQDYIGTYYLCDFKIKKCKNKRLLKLLYS